MQRVYADALNEARQNAVNKKKVSAPVKSKWQKAGESGLLQKLQSKNLVVKKRIFKNY